MYIWEHLCVSVHHMNDWSVQESEEGTEFLRLWARNLTWVLCKNSTYTSLLSHLSSSSPSPFRTSKENPVMIFSVSNDVQESFLPWTVLACTHMHTQAHAQSSPVRQTLPWSPDWSGTHMHHSAQLVTLLFKDLLSDKVSLCQLASKSL